MHIAQVLLSPRIGGAESLAASLAAEWERADISSEVIYLDGAIALSRIERLRALRRSIRVSKADVVIAHSAIPNIYARLVCGRRQPVIAVLHSASDDFSSRFMRAAEKVAYRRHPTVVAVSEMQADGYKAHFPQHQRPRVIPNGVRSDLSFRSSAGRVPHTAITIARVAAQKNPPLWVDTVQRLAKSLPELSFHWWGPVSNEPGIGDLVEEQNSSGGKGRFEGPISDPRSKLFEGDVYFHPSSREAHSVSLLEAAMVGLPIVCSESVARTAMPGLATETFVDDSGSSAAAAIERVIRDWDNANSDRIEISRLVSERFGMKNCASAYTEVCMKLISERVGN